MPLYETRTCRHCGISFRSQNPRREFCRDACRVMHHREAQCYCFYCGAPADTRDHPFPRSKFKVNNGYTVACCNECNATCGNKDFDERFDFLVSQYTKKYQLDKIQPTWNEDELEELGESLRMHVQAKITTRQQAMARILHIQARKHELE